MILTVTWLEASSPIVKFLVAYSADVCSRERHLFHGRRCPELQDEIFTPPNFSTSRAICHSFKAKSRTGAQMIYQNHLEAPDSECRQNPNACQSHWVGQMRPLPSYMTRLLRAVKPARCRLIRDQSRSGTASARLQKNKNGLFFASRRASSTSSTRLP
jgi:hypothetical protein